MIVRPEAVGTPPVLFWWNGPSQHMAPCMRAFQDVWPAEVRAIWCGRLSPERTRLGWRLPALGGVAEEYLPEGEAEARARTESIVASSPGAVHIYGGMKAVPRVEAAYGVAKGDPRARHVLVAEPFRGWGILRRSTRHVRAFLQSLPYRRRVDALLAMGEAGRSFYRQIGFPGSVIYPFIYQSPPGTSSAAPAVSDPLRVVYVGSFHRRKGLPDLLAAAALTRRSDWHLTVVGDGPERAALEDAARRRGLAERITWRGVVPHDELVEELPRHDVAVVPSRFDGWGAVTNEALQAGLAVITTDRCSSRDLVQHSGAGAIVSAGRPGELAGVLDAWVADPGAVASMKERARGYAARISGEAVAGYLGSVLEHALGKGGERPVPPWTGP